MLVPGCTWPRLLCYLPGLQLNHGLALSGDGKTLYASSSDAAYSWTYDPGNTSIGGSRTTLVTGMDNGDHTTRTLLLSQKANGLLVVSRGSTSNIDAKASVLATGHSQIKAYNVTNITEGPYDFSSDGLRLGWGLRNSVGLAEHPDTGGIYSVENSVDEMRRNGKDIHQDNPGEELNFHGYLNGTTYTAQGSNYGYPGCFAAWKVDDIPNNSNLTVGSQFAIDNQDGVDDAFCAQQTAPRITFQAHMAPLDIVFNNSGKEAWVSFHGSWYVKVEVYYSCSFGDTHRSKLSSSGFAFTSLRYALHHCREVLLGNLSHCSFFRMFGCSPSCHTTLQLSLYGSGAVNIGSWCLISIGPC